MTIIILLISLLIPLSLVVGIVYVITTNKEISTNKLTLKELFLELGIFLTLIPSIFSFVYILFMAIDKRFPDVLNLNSFNNINSDLASYVSFLVVTFPLYLVLAWMKNKNLNTIEENRKNIGAFQYGIYLTIFSTSLFIVGSLIAIIYNFLMGELNTAFLLKILIIVFVSISLFLYSYFSLKRFKDENLKNSKIPMIGTVASIAVVALGIIYAIYTIGSPSEMRKRKFDDLRMTNISEIQNQVLNFWQRENKLPESLENIKGDGMSYFNLNLKDPKTKEKYNYKITENSTMTKTFGEDCRKFYPNRYAAIPNVTSISCEIPSKASFELCANFETVRVYDELGMDQSGFGFDKTKQYGLTNSSQNSAYGSGVKGPAAMAVPSPEFFGKGGYEMSYYGGGYDRNPSWNHDKGEFCFKRTIDPIKYTSFR
jgi:hypothetical protein